MKRSEMVEKIKKCLLEETINYSIGHLENDYESYLLEAEEDAKTLLCNLEEAGMMPPNILDMKTPFYTWEPEDTETLERRKRASKRLDKRKT